MAACVLLAVFSLLACSIAEVQESVSATKSSLQCPTGPVSYTENTGIALAEILEPSRIIKQLGDTNNSQDCYNKCCDFDECNVASFITFNDEKVCALVYCADQTTCAWQSYSTGFAAFLSRQGNVIKETQKDPENNGSEDYTASDGETETDGGMLESTSQGGAGSSSYEDDSWWRQNLFGENYDDEDDDEDDDDDNDDDEYNYYESSEEENYDYGTTTTNNIDEDETNEYNKDNGFGTYTNEDSANENKKNEFNDSWRDESDDNDDNDDNDENDDESWSDATEENDGPYEDYNAAYEWDLANDNDIQGNMDESESEDEDEDDSEPVFNQAGEKRAGELHDEMVKSWEESSDMDAPPARNPTYFTGLTVLVATLCIIGLLVVGINYVLKRRRVSRYHPIDVEGLTGENGDRQPFLQKS